MRRERERESEIRMSTGMGGVKGEEKRKKVGEHLWERVKRERMREKEKDWIL